jgi:two-component system OmpR family sensor kinase
VSALRAHLTRVLESTGAQVSVYDAADRLLASNVSPPLARHEERAPERPPWKLFPEPPSARGVRVLPLDPAHRESGYAVFARPASRHQPPSPALWALGVALIGAAVASVVLARSFVSPLSLLASAADKLGAGDLGARVRSRRRDEFGQLARAFDDMADQLTMVLRSQQELLANVSHELRTPLARIRVALDIAAEGDAATAQESLREIGEDLGELERLVADVLQTAKLDLAAGRAGAALPLLRREEIDLSVLLEAIAQRFRAAAPARRLDVSLEPDLPSVEVDPTLLRRALDNLLANARAYSDEDTAIELRARREQEGVSLAVIDRGIGIAAEDLPQVSRPFFRTDKSRARRTGGLGLGLSLARRIVEAHAGQLRIESELGRGTTVRITLPA